MSLHTVPVPKAIIEECPLPEDFRWRDKPGLYWPGIWDIKERDWFGWAYDIDGLIGARGAKGMFDAEPFDSIEDALRYVWVQFIHGRES